MELLVLFMLISWGLGIYLAVRFLQVSRQKVVLASLSSGVIIVIGISLVYFPAEYYPYLGLILMGINLIIYNRNRS